MPSPMKLRPASVVAITASIRAANEGSTANGSRFGPDGLLYVADYTGHNILQVDPVTKALRVFAHEARMSQPNDLAMAADGTIYASDPDWQAGTGRIWHRMGDLGYFDSEGRLWFCGRKAHRVPGEGEACHDQ